MPAASESPATAVQPKAAPQVSFDQARQLVLAMRPRQWAKNLLLYLAFFFTLGTHDTDGAAGELRLFGEATLAFLLFCLLSGATYLINDLMDAEADRLHPKKQHRPLASGRLIPAFAKTAAGIAIAAGVGLSFLLDAGFGVIAVVYLGVTLGYNVQLKHMVILDVMAVAAGFVLRAAAGAQVIDVPISEWLYVMTGLGALLISLGKRRDELLSLGDSDAANHRPVLEHYTVAFLDQLIAVVAPAALVAYTLYTFTADNLPGDNSMMLTIPFVMYGVFRYLFLVHRRNLGGEPEEIFLTDRPLFFNIMLWVAAAIAILAVDRYG